MNKHSIGMGTVLLASAGLVMLVMASIVFIRFNYGEGYPAALNSPYLKALVLLAVGVALLFLYSPESRWFQHFALPAAVIFAASAYFWTQLDTYYGMVFLTGFLSGGSCVLVLVNYVLKGRKAKMKKAET